MEKTNAIWVGLACLLAGFLISYVFVHQTEVQTKDVPGPVIYQDRNITIQTDLLKDAKADFWKEFSEDSDYWVCGRDEYELEEISFTALPSYDIQTSKDKQIVTFDARMRFDVDDERPCYDTLEVEVTYEDDEKPVIEIN